MPESEKTPEDKPTKLPTSSPDALEKARAQADEHDGFARGAPIATPKTDEKFTVPSVLLLDDDQLIAYEELHHKLNQCDRWPDTEMPAQKFVQKNPDGTELETSTGAHTQRGAFIQPYQKDDALITPPYSIQLAHIFWGEDGYQRFKAGGGRSAEIPQLLQELNDRVQERAASDSKSDGGSVDLEPVSTPDSQ